MSRHARHIALAQIGTDGQQKISDASVLLIGVGGIGCAAASYLASSGVGHIALNDFDTVDETTKQEMRIMFEQILPRLRNPQFAGPVKYMRSYFVNGIKEMPITFTPET